MMPRHNETGGAPEACDVLVVGAGLAGLETAKQLDLRGATSVLVLETGPRAELRHLNTVFPPDRALRMWLDTDTDPHFHRSWKTLAPPHYMVSSGIRRRVGGRSVYWYGVVLPVESWALTEDAWPTRVISDLTRSWAGGAGLYQRWLSHIDIWRAAGPVEPRTVVSENGAVLGDHRLTTTPRATRRSRNHPDRWFAYSPLDYWRDPDTGETLRETPGVTVRDHAEVIRIIVEAGRCRGAVVRDVRTGNVREVRSDNVVLAAGTLESSRLAIQALHSAGELPRARLCGLNDHIVQGFFLRVPLSRARTLLEAVPAGSYYEPCPSFLSNLFVDITPHSENEVLVDVRVTGEQEPTDEGYVECQTGQDAPWPVAVHASTSPRDKEMIRAQRAVLHDVWANLARLTGRLAHTLSFADFDRPVRTNAFVLPRTLATAELGRPSTWSSVLGSEDHEGGTLPLGRLLTENQEFQRIEGLFAVGPSTFPRTGAANPSLTTLALAERLAARLAPTFFPQNLEQYR